MTINIIKSFNAFVKYAQRLAITILVEFIKGTPHIWLYERE